MQIFYLHGFASSPQSTKAQFLSDRLAALGMTLHCPDFNAPDFSTLTVSRMLQQLEAEIAALPPDEIVLIGSSLGGFVAIEAARRQVNHAGHPIARLVLLAPAVELDWESWSEIGAGGLGRWRDTGEIQVFHYADDCPRALKFSFYEDAIRYAGGSVPVRVPVLVFQGRHDEVVDPSAVERFVRAQAEGILFLLEDDHQLRNSLDVIWWETASVLGIGLIIGRGGDAPCS